MRALTVLLLASQLLLPQETASRRADLRVDRSVEQRIAKLRTDEQIGAYQKLAASRPDDLHVRTLLAAAYLQKLRESPDPSYLARASEVVEKALVAEPAHYESLRLRNEIALQRHEFRRVVQFSRDMIESHPSDPGVWGNLGDAYLELGEYEEAGRAYEKMFSLRPSQGSYNRAAFFAFVTGRTPAALQLMLQAVEAGSANPENTAWCMAELGDMYFKSGKIVDARRWYTEALTLFPKLHRALAGLGRVEYANGNSRAAVDAFKRAQAAVPAVEYAGGLASLYQWQGDHQHAKEQWALIDVIDKLGKSNGEAANRNLALQLADGNRQLERALQLVKAELENRQDIYTYDAQSWVLYRLKWFNEAQQASRKALRFNTAEPSFFYHAGMIESALGNRTKARELLQNALSLNPNFDPVQSRSADETLRALQ